MDSRCLSLLIVKLYGLPLTAKHHASKAARRSAVRWKRTLRIAISGYKFCQLFSTNSAHVHTPTPRFPVASKRARFPSCNFKISATWSKWPPDAARMIIGAVPSERNNNNNNNDDGPHLASIEA